MNAVVTSTCTQVSWTFRNFPNMPHNTIKEIVTVGHMRRVGNTFTFDGAGAPQATAINGPPGRNRIDTNAKWKGNGLKGGFDIASGKTCPPAPAFTIEKLQLILGLGGGFTSSPLIGQIGQTVEYEIIVRNTGNVPLVLSNFSDPNCDRGTLMGGQEETPLQPGPTPATGGFTTYTCTHVLSSVEPYENNASVTATPPPGDGAPIVQTSDTVVVSTPPEPGFSIEKLQKIEGSFTTSPLTGKSGQVVDYEIVVKNTGNTTLMFSSLTDAHCDTGTISGGPGSKALSHGESTTFTCSHTLTATDQTAGSYSNTADITGTPPEGGGIPHTSNPVVVSVPAPPPAPVVYVGYADTSESDHGSPSGRPTPWKGSEGVTFIGCGYGGVDSCPTSKGGDSYDAGAIRIEAPSGSAPLSVTGASVVIGPCTYEPWPSLGVTIQPQHSLILTQTGKHQCTSSTTAERDNFDTSESFLKSPQYQQFLKTKSCANDGYTPMITLTINGHTTTLSDAGQILNTGGIDPDICHGTSEAVNWTQLKASAGARKASALACQATPHHGPGKRGPAHPTKRSKAKHSQAPHGAACTVKPAQGRGPMTVPVLIVNP